MVMLMNRNLMLHFNYTTPTVILLIQRLRGSRNCTKAAVVPAAMKKETIYGFEWHRYATLIHFIISFFFQDEIESPNVPEDQSGMNSPFQVLSNTSLRVSDIIVYITYTCIALL